MRIADCGLRIGLLLGLLCLVGSARAVEPMVWRDHTQQAFAEGEPEGVSLTGDGAVTLSPVLEEVADTGEGFVWALAEGAKGRLYIATGNSGKLFELGVSGEPELLFDSPEVAIFSLAVGPDGTVYAGSSPDGLIYRLAPGKDPQTFCRTGDEHVWALVAGGSGGLYAATGGKQGRILRISAGGAVEEVYKSDDPNMVSLIRGADGRLYAGTDESGLVYRVDATGKVAVLYDAPEGEIHALALSPDGVVYAGAMGDKSDEGGGNGNGSPQKPQAAAPSQKGAALYAIRPSGSALRLWEVQEPMLLALDVDANGEITALTGDKGTIYRVRPDGTATLLARMPDAQPWTFSRSRTGELWVGTAGAGRVYRLGKAYAREGTLTSKPRDFSLVSTWGKVAWRAETPAGTSVVFQTRSGNSEKPDDTWSDWSGPLAEPAGSQISSPPARFLQYRARLTSEADAATPLLRGVSLAGLQENVQPQVISIAVEALRGPGNGTGPGPGPEGGKGRRPGEDLQKGVWKVAWAAGDANNDRLVYDLYFRGQGEKHWKLLESDLTTPSYLWQIDSAPEGTMQVRVVASDRMSNPASIALSSERVSEPFDLDHTPPAVRVTARQAGPKTVVVEGKAEDATSPIREAAYAVNSSEWQIIFPADRIFDSTAEALEFTLSGLAAGEYTVVVRAVDALGNVGVGKAVVEVK